MLGPAFEIEDRSIFAGPKGSPRAAACARKRTRETHDGRGKEGIPGPVESLEASADLAHRRFPGRRRGNRRKETRCRAEVRLRPAIHAPPAVFLSLGCIIHADPSHTRRFSRQNAGSRRTARSSRGNARDSIIVRRLFDPPFRVNHVSEPLVTAGTIRCEKKTLSVCFPRIMIDGTLRRIEEIDSAASEAHL